MTEIQDRTTIYIDGRWVPSTGSTVIEVENPATEQVIARVPAGTEEDVAKAIAAARRAFPSWSQTTVHARAGLLRKLQQALAKREDNIALTVSMEMGSPMRISKRIQAPLPQVVVGAYADLVESYEFEENVGNTLVTREPAGVVGAITPWNYPLHQITNKLAPALAAGCTFVLKPSEVSPLVAYLLMDAVDEAGFPPGVVNMVPGYGPEVGEALASSPDIDVISFTGSQRAGTRVAQVAAPNVTRVTLELGGKSANVILDDADFSIAVKVGVANAFLNSGQTCVAWTRMLVPADRYEEVVQMAAGFANTYTVGDPLDPATKLGPVANRAQRDKVLGLIDTARAEGARVVVGGTDKPAGLEHGYYVAPTILADVDPDSTIAQEEVFGPVLSILSYTDEDDAAAIANNSRYGLSGGVWSATNERALAFARRIRTGNVDINGAAYNPMAPFGGYKRSGIGREMGREGLEEFLEVKSIQQ
ncbi:aldehyde dehydrogenase (NAD+) [Cryobacterium flavum]|uniref:aldehyde dehydrogenase (NAD(+)) n=1 Tax=Cryobacterium flavum TaxID=1424659 RepID=A0A4R8UZI9_9MICO|nr:aldehyde dehydrogenase family protein [Cryobacterium flavum]TFB73618.1 aldehyde dehydrogenase family protein [Cryobacterium flavum]SDO32509.1 aldehyde dehydrogenase (NAD+) [Cryobacterium flavum]